MWVGSYLKISIIMKKMNNLFKKSMHVVILRSIVILLLFSACHERTLEPLVNIGGKPGVVSNVSVENGHGASKIYYTLPDDQQLLYVEAEYVLGNGEVKTVKSSVFKNFVELEGFVSTNEREVTLYTVNRGEVRSDPIQVKINPLISPLELAYASLTPTGDFGGVNIKYENEFEHEYVLNLLYKEDGEWLVYDKFYSSVKEPGVIFRGLEAVPQDFGIYLVDRWRNRSDTLFQNLTPLYEAEIEKNLMKHYPLDNDYFEPTHATRLISNVWDGPSTAAGNNFVLKTADSGLGFPWWFTIDLGKQYFIGRMKMLSSPAQSSGGAYSFFFQNTSPKVFEVWGSNDPAIDGSWDSWTLLERFESVKPSGLPIGNNTADDIALGLAGEDFTFSNYDVGYQYIRVNIVDSWSSQFGFILQEMTLWGAPVNE